MQKKCPASYSSTSHKRQRSGDKSSSRNKKHSHKTAAESCDSEKPTHGHRDELVEQFPVGPYPISTPASNCSPEILFGINCSPNFGTDSSPFPCSCSKKYRKKTQRRPCSAVNPKGHCPYNEKTSQLERSRYSGAREECCCGVPRKKKEKSKTDKRQHKVKPAKDSKAPKEPKLGKFRKERNPQKAIFEERKICEPEDQEADILASDCRRPCNCWESQVAKPAERKKSRNSCSKLLCCSCFKTFWKKKKKKRLQGTAAPCKRYLCLHNPGRSEFDEAIPCVKCTHNCGGARHVEEGVKELPAGELPIIKPCPDSSTANSKPTKNITCEASGSARQDAPKSNVIKNKEKCETSETEDILERRSLPKEHKKNHAVKSTAENTRKSSKRKPCKDAKKGKKTITHGLPKSCTPTAGTSSMENRCCPCKIPETTEVKLKTKPCMKCPEKMMVGGKSSCKKLTFASCTELRDYKLDNKNTDTVKKRGAMGIVFDVIFWPYVFWPGRSDPCK